MASRFYSLASPRVLPVYPSFLLPLRQHQNLVEFYPSRGHSEAVAFLSKGEFNVRNLAYRTGAIARVKRRLDPFTLFTLLLIPANKNNLEKG
jgi:hypothetical protein